ncbi:hypothetical protein NLG97_g9718 [Lecanicillium saksenae]|uniref:Uncharacterized protein n=1 Tax=Lecanicillium saksenae TaxID=468837 RepID=A0ACC1QFR7_9HYPO|nr:hypothetical protein NLG97_g9718 [Lecanicillium saksenae]
MVLANTSKSTAMRITKMKSSSKPVGITKRSCQDRASVEIGTPKAMKDPNWRTRQDTGSSTDFDITMPPMDLHVKHFSQLGSSQDINAFQHDRSRSDISILEKYSSESSAASENLVKIVRKIDLKPIDGRQMSIFELDLRTETPTPVSSSEDGRYVTVSRNTSGHQRDLSSATDSTQVSHPIQDIQSRDLFHLVDFDRLSRQSSSVASSHMHLHHSRTIDDSKFTRPFGTPVTVSKDRTPIDKPTQSHQTAIRNNRDEAFQRLIQRLNRDTYSTTNKWSPRKVQTQQKSAHPEPTGNIFPDIRKPIQGAGRRNQTISDFNVDYWENSHSSVTSQVGSEHTVQSSSKQSTWNPKAREFLSLGHQQNSRRPIPWDNINSSSPAKQPTFNSVPPSANAAWPGVNSQMTNPYPPPRDHDMMPNNLSNPPVPSAPAVPQPAPMFNLGLTPESFAQTQYLPGTSAPQPLFPVSSLTGMPAPMMPFGNYPAQQLAAQQLAAQQVAAQQIAALPYLASLASLGPLPPLLTGLDKPNFPANPRRPPVPKPTLPNASAQLAYEEWIEWRKAHEPGYAVECKARQQRRSQRVKGPKDGGDKPTEARLPVTAAAAA